MVSDQLVGECGARCHQHSAAAVEPPIELRLQGAVHPAVVDAARRLVQNRGQWRPMTRASPR